MAGLSGGRTTVATAGTRVVLGASVSMESVAVQALSTNTGTVVVGGSDVVAAAGTRKGIALAANDVVSVDTDDLGEIWVDSTVNGEGVNYLVSTEA